MHGLLPIKGDPPLNKRGDCEMEAEKKTEHLRWLQHARFRWHEAVLKDPVIRKYPSAIALAGHIMHRFQAEKGFAQFSITSAEKALGFDQRTLKRARKLLQQRGWIRPDDRPVKQGPGGWRANRYILSGGPEDLLFDETAESDGDDTDAWVSPTSR